MTERLHKVCYLAKIVSLLGHHTLHPPQIYAIYQKLANNLCWVKCVPEGWWRRKHSSAYLLHPHESSHPEIENWCSQSCHLPRREKKCSLIQTQSPGVPFTPKTQHNAKSITLRKLTERKTRTTYFEAMCLGSHTVGLDHGDEDGDVA